MTLYILSIVFILGCYLGLLLKINFIWPVGSFLAFLCLYFYSNYKKAAIITLVLITGFLSGLTYGNYNEISEDATYTAKIEEVISVGKYSSQYLAKINSRNAVLKVIRYKEVLLPGQIIEIEGRIVSLPEVSNPGQFSIKNYYRSTGLSGQIEVYGDKVKKVDFSEDINSLRYKLQSFINDSMERDFDKSSLPYIKALALGDRSDLQFAQRDAMIKSGIYHIMALSGLHVGILIMLFTILFTFLPIKDYWKKIFTIFALIIYAMIIGPRPSLLRAVLMGVVYLLADLLAQKPSPISTISFAGAVIIGISPYYLFNSGFWLSITAVLGIIFFYDKIKRALGKYVLPDSYVTSIISVTIAAQIGTLPLNLYFFNNLPMAFIFTNILVLPLVTLTLGLIWLYLVIGIWLYPLGAVISGLISTLIAIIDKIASVGEGVNLHLALPSPSIFIVLLFYLLVLLYPIIKSKEKLRIYSLAFLLLLVFYIPALIPDGDLKITILDVGQGDSIHISTPGGKSILIDGGESYAGYSVVLPFLKSIGSKGLDLILLTHSHSDHMDGLVSVIKGTNTSLVIIPKIPFTDKSYNDFLHLVNSYKIPVHRTYAGQIIEIEKDIHMEIIHPQLKALVGTASDLNNNSIVFYLYYKDIVFLFTGDVEKEGEHQMLNGLKKVDVLKVAHHGSRNSTTIAFLNRTNPDFAVISVGANRYGHPHQELLNRLHERQIKVYRTDISGAITIRTDGKNLEITTFK